jgi:hypothetical protein
LWLVKLQGRIEGILGVQRQSAGASGLANKSLDIHEIFIKLIALFDRGVEQPGSSLGS